MLLSFRSLGVVVVLATFVNCQNQNPFSQQLSYSCGPNTTKAVCINLYASLLPYDFYRVSVSGHTSPQHSLDWTFASTLIPGSITWAPAVAQANFLLFDTFQGLSILGTNATYTVILQTNASRTYQAPVWVPSQNKIYFGITGVPGYLPLGCVDLTHATPVITNFETDPPLSLYEPGDAVLFGGKILVAAAGSNITHAVTNGFVSYRPGLVVIDPATGTEEWMLNNYFGYFFNGLSGVTVDAYGDVWFTDSCFSWFAGDSDTPPQMGNGVYRFVPSTGAVNVAEDTLGQPSSIALSPNGRTMYISDAAAGGGSSTGTNSTGMVYNATNPHTVYAYDVLHTAGIVYLQNKRPIYKTMEWFPEAVKTSAEGYVLVAAGKGIDVLNPWGTVIMKVQTNFTVKNFVWTGPRLATLWIFGVGNIAKVEWTLQGPLPSLGRNATGGLATNGINMTAVVQGQGT